MVGRCSISTEIGNQAGTLHLPYKKHSFIYYKVKVILIHTKIIFFRYFFCRWTKKKRSFRCFLRSATLCVRAGSLTGKCMYLSFILFIVYNERSSSWMNREKFIV